MLKGLSLPPGAIFKKYKNGNALRNDGVKLKPANQNPWYLLATVVGEYNLAGRSGGLQARNRRYWNGFMCDGLSDTERREIAAKFGVDKDELKPLTQDEIKTVEARFGREHKKIFYL